MLCTQGTVSSRLPTPPTRINYREHVGRTECVKGGNLDVRGDGSRQRVRSFINELEQGSASLTDEDFARLESMIVEKRGRSAVHVIVAPIDTAQPCNLRSRS